MATTVSDEEFQMKMKNTFANDNSWARQENIVAFADWAGQFAGTVTRWINGTVVPSPYIRTAILADVCTFFTKTA